MMAEEVLVEWSLLESDVDNGSRACLLVWMTFTPARCYALENAVYHDIELFIHM